MKQCWVEMALAAGMSALAVATAHAELVATARRPEEAFNEFRVLLDAEVPVRDIARMWNTLREAGLPLGETGRELSAGKEIRVLNALNLQGEMQ